MREQDYVGRAKLSPAHRFKSPMDVVETSQIERGDKVAILKSWEADELALLRAEDEGMGGRKHAHLRRTGAHVLTTRCARNREGSAAAAQATMDERAVRATAREPL